MSGWNADGAVSKKVDRRTGSRSVNSRRGEDLDAAAEPRDATALANEKFAALLSEASRFEAPMDDPTVACRSIKLPDPQLAFE